MCNRCATCNKPLNWVEEKPVDLLSNAQLAVKAQGHLMISGGFTLDEFGDSITGDLWAVSVEGKEQKYSFFPSLQLIENYLEKHGDRCGAYFGGWKDDDGTYYLDHTIVFQHKHTAVHEAKRNHQKAIFHLETKELFEIEEAEKEQDEGGRRELVKQLCDEYGPQVIMADLDLYLAAAGEGT